MSVVLLEKVTLGLEIPVLDGALLIWDKDLEEVDEGADTGAVVVVAVTDDGVEEVVVEEGVVEEVVVEEGVVEEGIVEEGMEEVVEGVVVVLLDKSFEEIGAEVGLPDSAFSSILGISCRRSSTVGLEEAML